ALERLEAASKARTGTGYALVTKEVAHQKLGALRVPERIIFESVQDLAACADETRALHRFEALAQKVTTFEPRLLPWLAERPLRVLEYEAAMPQLLAVARRFQSS